MHWLRSAVRLISDGNASSSGWDAEIWITNDHPVTWIESGDRVCGWLEAGIKIGQDKMSSGTKAYSQIVNVHVEHRDGDEAAIVCEEVQLRCPVVTLVILHQRRRTCRVQCLVISHVKGKVVSTLNSVNVSRRYIGADDGIHATLYKRPRTIKVIDSKGAFCS